MTEKLYQVIENKIENAKSNDRQYKEPLFEFLEEIKEVEGKEVL